MACLKCIKVETKYSKISIKHKRAFVLAHWRQYCSSDVDLSLAARLGPVKDCHSKPKWAVCLDHGWNMIPVGEHTPGPVQVITCHLQPWVCLDWGSPDLIRVLALRHCPVVDRTSLQQDQEAAVEEETRKSQKQQFCVETSQFCYVSVAQHLCWV